MKGHVASLAGLVALGNCGAPPGRLWQNARAMNSKVDIKPGAGAGIPWRVAPPLVSTALLMIGSGFLGSLLPLRFSALGLSDGVIGLLATAEALGFLAGCLYAHRLIAPVGLERAYATFAGLKSVAILGLYFSDGVPTLGVLRFLIGVNAAGLAIIVE